jgi:DNA-binding Lrp family transcriptional regulator
MKLTEAEQLVYSVALTRAQSSVQELSKLCGLREHSVRRALSKLFELGVFERKAVMLNNSALGLTNFKIFASLEGASEEESATFIADMKEHSRVRVFAELASEYQYELDFLVNSVQELNTILQNFNQLYARKLRIHSMVIAQGDDVYGPKWLLPPSIGIKPIKCREVVPQTIDETDHKILQRIGEQDFRSMRDLARELSIPNSTLMYRLERLEQVGIIASYFYVFNVKRVRRLPFYLLVEYQGISTDTHEKFLQYCESHRAINYITRCTGQWSYLVMMEVADFEEARIVRNEVHDSYFKDLARVVLIPQVTYHRYSAYPFKDLDEVQVATSR